MYKMCRSIYDCEYSRSTIRHFSDELEENNIRVRTNIDNVSKSDYYGYFCSAFIENFYNKHHHISMQHGIYADHDKNDYNVFVDKIINIASRYNIDIDNDTDGDLEMIVECHTKN